MALAESWPETIRIGFDGASDDVFGDMINALRAGEIDAVVDDEPAFGGLLDQKEFEIAFTVETANRWGAAMHPDSKQLAGAINEALESLKTSGELRSIWQTWFAAIAYPDLTR